jgi:mono/diheme cytochrome c family protein
MIRLAVMLAASAMLHAQSAMVKRGAEVFGTTCAVAYCHGAEGTEGRAPKLAGRAFSAKNLLGVIVNGKSGTSMPGFSQQLNADDIEAVARYILSLSGAEGADWTESTVTFLRQYILSLSGTPGMESASPKPSGTEPPLEAQKGRALFFDAVRMGGCGTCHELGDRGSLVGPDLKAVSPAQIRGLRTAPGMRVVTASPVGEEPFPALQVEQTPEQIRVYDLTSPLPVLRTFQPAQVRITPGGAWSHAKAIRSYSDADLGAISGYLMWVLRTQSGK